MLNHTDGQLGRLFVLGGTRMRSGMVATANNLPAIVSPSSRNTCPWRNGERCRGHASQHFVRLSSLTALCLFGWVKVQDQVWTELGEPVHFLLLGDDRGVGVMARSVSCWVSPWVVARRVNQSDQRSSPSHAKYSNPRPTSPNVPRLSVIVPDLQRVHPTPWSRR